MRRLTTFGAVLLAGLALSAMLAGGAYAKSYKPTLILKEGGTTLANGAGRVQRLLLRGVPREGAGQSDRHRKEQG